jgi:hypothetical protein
MAIRENTVIVLGAGASVPYGFPSGEKLLRDARALDIDGFEEFVRFADRPIVKTLRYALRGTLERSIDAALETQVEDVVDAGKLFMARSLLQREFAMRDKFEDHAGKWHEILWEVCDSSSLDAFRASKITLITYNYDRSVEYALIRALSTKFSTKEAKCAAALDCIGPIHLHGQLGLLPAFGASNDLTVPFGGSDADEGPTERDFQVAANAIRIVHEPRPTDEPFMRARDAIGAATRIIFLGFSYAKNNVERLLLHDCLKKESQVYLCLKGFSAKEAYIRVVPHFSAWSNRMMGEEDEDIVKFFKHYPEALL